MKHYIMLFCSTATLVVCARDFQKGTLAWNMQRQAAQFVPDVMITQNMVGAGGFTITQPGTYGLAENIAFSAASGIVIDASDVVLNLDGHTITGTIAGTGVVVQSGRSHIIITNGNIVNCAECIDLQTTSSLIIVDRVNCFSLLGAGSIGILIGFGCADIIVRDCFISDAGFGIHTIGTRVLIDNCFITNCGSFGIDLTAGDASEIRDCCIESCGTTGIQLNIGTNTVISRCNVSACGLFGVLVTVGADGTMLEGCVARNCTTGFSVVDGIMRSTLLKCVAYGNSGNGITNDGIDTNISSCISHNNGGIGFSDNGTPPRAVGNIAYANTGGDFSANIIATGLVALSYASTVTANNAWFNISPTP